MVLTDSDLRLIRDEIGEGPPDDDALYEAADTADTWQAVAVSVLKRRRAAALAGGSTGSNESIQIPGVISFSSGSSSSSLAGVVAALDAQIARLTALAGLPGGVMAGGYLVRTDSPRYRPRAGLPVERFRE